jgi:hypothetical protein
VEIFGSSMDFYFVEFGGKMGIFVFFLMQKGEVFSYLGDV